MEGLRHRLVLRGRCDCDCVFCRPDRSAPSTDPSVALQDLRDGYAPGRGLNIGGDEPTTHPALPEVIAAARELGYKPIALQTTGQLFAQPGFARLLRDLGLDAADIPLYGSNAAVHEAITRRPGSFRRTLAGLARLRAVGLDLVIHTVVTRENVSDLSDLVGFCLARGLPLPRIEHLQPERAFPYAEHAVSLADSAAALATVARDHLAQMLFVNFPACFAKLLPESLGTGLAITSAPGTAQRPKRHAAVCRSCALGDSCPGPFVGYLDLFGDGDLRPVSTCRPPRR